MRCTASLLILTAGLLFIGAAARAADPVIRFEAGDPLWAPSPERLTKWVDEGITAGMDEVELPTVANVTRWAWSSDRGLKVPTEEGPNRTLRCVIVVTPQALATIAGYAAACHEATYQRINADRAAVVSDIVGRLAISPDLLIVAVVNGPDGELPAAIYVAGSWHSPDREQGRLLDDFMDGTFPAGQLTPYWAATFAMASCEGKKFLDPRERTRLYLYHLTPATPPNHLIPATPPTRRPFAEALPVPRSKSGEVIRVAFGDENGFVYADVGG